MPDQQASLRYKRLPFWQRVGVTNSVDDCWPWLGAKNPVTGYGTLSGVYAHRRAYELSVGPIPPGLTIDHLCCVRECCNPTHMEVVTRGENARRGEKNRRTRSGGRHLAARTACKHGHEYVEGSFWLGPRGERRCRPCQRRRSMEFRERAGVSHA